jgi:hypothetical protein
MTFTDRTIPGLSGLAGPSSASRCAIRRPRRRAPQPLPRRPQPRRGAEISPYSSTVSDYSSVRPWVRPECDPPPQHLTLHAAIAGVVLELRVLPSALISGPPVVRPGQALGEDSDQATQPGLTRAAFSQWGDNTRSRTTGWRPRPPGPRWPRCPTKGPDVGTGAAASTHSRPALDVLLKRDRLAHHGHRYGLFLDDLGSTALVGEHVRHHRAQTRSVSRRWPQALRQ